MILATGKLGKKFIFLIFILVLIALFAFIIPPTNLALILIMNILVSAFFYFLFKIFLTKKTALTFSFPIFFRNTTPSHDTNLCHPREDGDPDYNNLLSRRSLRDLI